MHFYSSQCLQYYVHATCAIHRLLSISNSSLRIASSPASCSECILPPNFMSGHCWLIVCCSPHTQRSDGARPHLCRLWCQWCGTSAHYVQLFVGRPSSVKVDDRSWSFLVHHFHEFLFSVIFSCMHSPHPLLDIIHPLSFVFPRYCLHFIVSHQFVVSIAQLIV